MNTNTMLASHAVPLGPVADLCSPPTTDSVNDITVYSVMCVVIDNYQDYRAQFDVPAAEAAYALAIRAARSVLPPHGSLWLSDPEHGGIVLRLPGVAAGDAHALAEGLVDAYSRRAAGDGPITFSIGIGGGTDCHQSSTRAASDALRAMARTRDYGGDGIRAFASYPDFP
jgi:hypothetical protein